MLGEGGGVGRTLWLPRDCSEKKKRMRWKKRAKIQGPGRLCPVAHRSTGKVRAANKVWMPLGGVGVGGPAGGGKKKRTPGGRGRSPVRQEKVPGEGEARGVPVGRVRVKSLRGRRRREPPG